MNIKKHFGVYKDLPKDMYIIFLSILINRSGSFIMPLMTLILTKKIGFSNSAAGLFSTIAMLSQAPFLILGGKLSDKFGSKKIIVISNYIGALFYLICSFLKPDFGVAVLIIAASDVYSIASPAFNSIITEVTPAPLIKNAFSFTYLGFNLGLVIGPSLGGMLFNTHLNLLFLIDALTTLVATTLIFFYVNNKIESDNLMQNNKLESTDISSENSIISFFKKDPLLVMFSFTLLLYNFCYIQWSFMLPLQTSVIFKHDGVKFYSLLVSINAITVISLTPLLTSITQKMPPLKSIFAGGIFYFISFSIFSINRFMPVFIISIIILTIGEIFISINTNNYITLHTPKKYIGRANSLLFIVNGTGYAVGPAVMGNLLIILSFHNAWLLLSAIMLLGVLSLYLVKHFEKDASNR